MVKFGDNMNCPYCLSKLNWNSDFDYEDYNLEGEGIVSMCHCPSDSCDTEILVYYTITKKEEDLNES